MPLAGLLTMDLQALAAALQNFVISLADICGVHAQDVTLHR
jgi:hypothetical protein